MLIIGGSQVEAEIEIDRGEGEGAAPQADDGRIRRPVWSLGGERAQPMSHRLGRVCMIF